MIEIFAPGGIGEVGPGCDLAALAGDAIAADPSGPLRPGDIVVVTSKIVSKAEGRFVPATGRAEAITAQTDRTVAARGSTRIVRTHAGLTVAAAGVDNSNVAPESVLLLPEDPDASADRLCRELSARAGGLVGVLISDTAGRAWRIGQSDHTIGAAGLRLIERYAGRVDPYGNPLAITAMAVGDELAGAADLVKRKLTGRPVAVVRGLPELVGDETEPATALLRPPELDLFGYGSREAVLAAVLSVTGQSDRYEELVGLPLAEVTAEVRADSHLDTEARELLTAVLTAAFRLAGSA